MSADNVTERARRIVSGAMFGLTTPMMVDAIVSDLDAAGLLVTPEHDAAVAAKALREAADDVRATLNVDQSRPLTIEQAMHAVDFWLRGRADRIGREAGESGADT